MRFKSSIFKPLTKSSDVQNTFNMNSFERVSTDQMMTATSLMIASFKQSKKSLRAWPCCFMLPMTKPKDMEKTTRPRAFTPPEEPDTGTVSSTVCCGERQEQKDIFSSGTELLARKQKTASVHLYGVHHPADVHVQVRLCHVERVGKVQIHCHVPCVNNPLIHSFILQKTLKQNKTEISNVAINS